MEQNTNQFSELINMIKEASGEKETKGIAIKETNNKLNAKFLNIFISIQYSQ